MKINYDNPKFFCSKFFCLKLVAYRVDLHKERSGYLSIWKNILVFVLEQTSYICSFFPEIMSKNQNSYCIARIVTV